MDISKIKELIELLENTSLSEIELKEGDESLRLSRQPVMSELQYSKPLAIMPAAPVPTVTSQPAAPEQKSTASAASAEKGHKIHAPMVGTLYSASSPDSPPFVTLGQSVKAGDILCIIEAMKMFNEIEADRAGIITGIHVTNGEPVEYNQLLFTIE